MPLLSADFLLRYALQGDYTVTKTVHNDTYPAIDPTSLKPSHEGRAVFISGASRGIGYSIAISYARAGASYIAIGARSDLTVLAKEIETAAQEAGRPKPKVLSLKLDVTDRVSVEAAAGEIRNAFGRLDVVVSNAASLGEMQLIADTDPDVWWNTWELNVKGQYLVMRTFIPLLLDTADGLKTICTVASVGAHLQTPTLSAYQPSKLANLRISEFASIEYADRGLIAYSVHPGNVPTPLAGGPELTNIPDPVKVAYTETAELPADTIAYLTAERREWLAGRYVNCTWDMLELEAQSEAIASGDALKVRLVLP